MSINRMNLFGAGGGAVRNISPYSGRAFGQNDRTGQSDARALRRALSDTGQNALYQKNRGGSNIVNDTMSYSESLRVSRAKTKDTSLQLKKLRYNFKALSTQILRSKTSSSAMQVASKARREVIRLKQQRQSGEYDEEELQSAIAHAQAMERVAKKKARHLQEEELSKAGGLCEGELGEKEDEKNRPAEEAAEDALARYGSGDTGLQDKLAGAAQEQIQDFQEIARQQMAALQEMMQSRMDEMQRAMEELSASLQEDPMEGMMSDMMDEMYDSMEEMLKNSGLGELADSMFATPETDVDPADYKMMKIKHRCKELKEIVEADAEYLKAIFDKLAREKEAGGMSLGGSPSGGGAVMTGGDLPRPEINVVSAPDAPMPSVPAVSGGSMDISI